VEAIPATLNLAEKPAIAFLKIDCEGFECQILQGARRLIEQHRPHLFRQHLFIEVHPTQLENFGSSTEQVLDLVARDYDLEFWHFQIGRHTSKLARSLAKFRRPKARGHGGSSHGNFAPHPRVERKFPRKQCSAPGKFLRQPDHFLRRPAMQVHLDTCSCQKVQAGRLRYFVGGFAANVAQASRLFRVKENSDRYQIFKNDVKMHPRHAPAENKNFRFAPHL
jgi:hypothetical protein